MMPILEWFPSLIQVGLNGSTGFTETPENTGGVPTPHWHQTIEEITTIPTDEDISNNEGI